MLRDRAPVSPVWIYSRDDTITHTKGGMRSFGKKLFSSQIFSSVQCSFLWADINISYLSMGLPEPLLLPEVIRKLFLKKKQTFEEGMNEYKFVKVSQSNRSILSSI